MSFGPPFGNNLSVSGANLTDPWASYNCAYCAGGVGNPLVVLQALNGIGHASKTLPFATAGNYLSFPLTDFHPMYVNQWNLSIQRQFGKDWLITANYLGNSSIHLTTMEGGNPAIFLGLGPCTLNVVNGAGQAIPTNYSTCSTNANTNQRRIRYLQNPTQGQYYAGIGPVDDGGTASYEGMYLSAQKRLSRGVTLLANYTWSHCISDVFDQNPTAAGVTGNIPGNRRAYRNNCVGSDLRQLFVLNMVATTPKFSNRWMRILASDWQIAPIMQIKSAQFFTVMSGTDRALSAAPGQTPNLVSPNPYPSGQSVTNWISRSAFAVPDLGTYGNVGYNNFKGPGVFQLNLALSRTFPIWEKRSIQLRAEAFNLPNHLNPFTPGIAPISGSSGGQQALNASNFGQITNDISGNNGLLPGDYRVIQLAMKFVF